ncbi:hypothetical protein [Flavihumibacter solisilvae]|uniref:Uncharacterized protein n=1 Tax=Flavihumibacter solisilvae TaxID=1349421 RepID=A0A0C1IP97_9BACT|nr:hypothetical protein [Flavihumibacter solisilvae]KIC96000.1 hypothetical protein OI18_02065 [Flavihumibacter solisilvae]
MKMICTFLAGGFLAISATAQTLQQKDLPAITRRITVLPGTVEALHKAFARQTPYGEKFSDAELNPVFEEIKKLVAAIHDQQILRQMKSVPRPDMPDSVHYQEIRWKLALRPAIAETSLAGIPETDHTSRNYLRQAIALQQVFDWQKYYKEDEALEKNFREQCNAITGSDLEAVRKRLGLQCKLYSRQAELWGARLGRYSQGISQLQQILQETAYGNNLTNRQAAIRILADVQARALESIEKLIWNEMQILMKAELLYQDLQILSTY